MPRDLIVNRTYALYHRLRRLLSHNIPLNTTHDTCNPFFIIGSGRCGTTLLREILNQHSALIIPPESYSIPMLYKKHYIYRDLPWEDYLSIIIAELEHHPEFYTWKLDLKNFIQPYRKLDKNQQSLRGIIKGIYRLYAKVNDKPEAIWGDKSIVNTLYLDYLDKIFIRPKYIHLVRDGYDVVASYLIAGLVKNMEEAAELWSSAIDYCNQFKSRNPGRILEIYYEKLVDQPEVEIRKVCNFLGIHFEDRMMDHSLHLTTGDLIHKHHSGVLNSINTDSVGRWRTYFTGEDKDTLEKLISKQREKHGYI